MISSTIRYLFDALAHTLFKKVPPSKPVDLDETSFYKTALNHGISGIVYYAIKDEKALKEETMRRFERDCYQTVQRSADQQYNLKKVIEVLNLHEINHVLMKGEVLRQIYPYPDMRQMGDVDMLVNEEDLPKIHELMKNIGFHFVSESDNHHVFVKSGLMIEFHNKLMPSRHPIWEDFFQSAFENTILLRESTYQFTYEYHLVYLIAHIAKHFKSQGSGIRSIFDIAVYIHAYDSLIDYSLVREYLRALHLTQFFDTVIELVYRWFHVESARFDANHILNDSLYEEVTQFILQCGTYGYSDENRGDAVSVGIEADKANSSIQKGRIRYIWRLAFPKASALRYKYKYLNKRPWLLPIAWAKRFWNLIFKRRNKAKRIRNVFTKDDDIRKIMNMYRSIGLL